MESTTANTVRSSLLHSITNFRDVAQSINQSHGTILQEGRLFRSARPDNASPSDREALRSVYNIVSIIDLRSTTERIDRDKKQGGKTTAESLKLPGVVYHEINLNGGSFARALVWKLSWLSLTKLLGLMAFGYRKEAIGILGREVMAPRGLIGLGRDSLDHCMSELHDVFTLLADASNYPILINCTQGKDRTGLVVVLLLLLLEVPLDAITADYVASEKELEGEMLERLEEIKQLGLGEEFAGCPLGFVQEICTHIEQGGGINEYLKRIGINQETQIMISENLLG